MIYFNKLNFFNKNYKNISISESSENLLSSIQNINQISPINNNKLVKKDSIEFSDFEQAIVLDNNLEQFGHFDDTIFSSDSNFIESDKDESSNTLDIINDTVSDIINNIITSDIVNNIVNDIIVNDEVSNTIEYLINYCEDFYIEHKYELVGYITNLLYKENTIVYVVRVNDPEQFKQFKINKYNIIGLEGIFYWNENSILKLNDKVLVECTYLGNSCKYKLNKIIKKYK
jgi:hypothetical protein